MDSPVASPLTPDFFVAGGTLPLGSDSYLERKADVAIIEALSAGRFCYVLNSRQMGKSSLCVRTMSRLTAAGTQCAFIDITKIGGRNVTAEQWYAGLTIEVGRSLNLRDEVLAYWKEETHVSPMQRFFGSLRHVVLEKIKGKVVVFVDEIDSTRSLSFNSDEFFAGVRECFNRRVQDPEFNRLTFCFLGVAVPSDLIHDARTTPFNIGERIYLKDFTREELEALSHHLGSNGKKVLDRVHYWTNGHPFLTQSVCRALVTSGKEVSEKDVDELIERDLLEPKVRETNINLSDVGNRVLNGYADGDDVEKFRADILSAYSKARAGKDTLQDDESNRITAVLKLSGLMRSEDATLKVRNRIYERAFGEAWIKENMPQQELRRQRRAYYAGVARTALIATAVVAVIGYLAINNYRLARAAEETAREMSWRAYVADMNRMPILLDQNNIPHMEKILDDHKNDPWRGAEWNYWNGTIHTAMWETTQEFGRLGGGGSNGGLSQKMVLSENGGLLFIDLKTGKVVRRLQVPKERRYVQLADGKSIVSVNRGGGGSILDVDTGATLRDLPRDVLFREGSGDYDAIGKRCIADRGLVQGIYDIEAGQFLLKVPNLSSFFDMVSNDGRLAVLVNSKSKPDIIEIYDIERRQARYTFSSLGSVTSTTLTSNNSLMVVGYIDGMVRLFNVSDGKLLWELKVADAFIGDVWATPDAKIFTAGTRKRRAYQIRVESGVPRVFRSYLDSGTVVPTADGKLIWTLYWTLRGYRADDGEPVKTYKPEGTWFVKHVANPDRIVLLSPKEARILPLNNGQLGTPTIIKYPAGMEGWSTPRSDPQVMLSDGSSVAIFEFGQGFKNIFTLHERPVDDLFMVLADRRILISKDRRTYSLYDATGKQTDPRVFSFETSTRLDQSPSGNLFAACSDSGDLALFDAKTLKQIWQVKEAHRFRPVIAATFSPDGKRMVTASHDDTAAIWDVADGSLIARLTGHSQSVIRAEFTPDGKRVITVSDDQTMRMWDAATGTELTTLGNVGDFPILCRITSDGKHIVTANQQSTIKIWPLYSSESANKESKP